MISLRSARWTPECSSWTRELERDLELELEELELALALELVPVVARFLVQMQRQRLNLSSCGLWLLWVVSQRGQQASRSAREEMRLYEQPRGPMFQQQRR